jgi:hypothetical protein
LHRLSLNKLLTLTLCRNTGWYLSLAQNPGYHLLEDPPLGTANDSLFVGTLQYDRIALTAHCLIVHQSMHLCNHIWLAGNPRRYFDPRQLAPNPQEEEMYLMIAIPFDADPTPRAKDRAALTFLQSGGKEIGIDYILANHARWRLALFRITTLRTICPALRGHIHIRAEHQSH